MTNLVRKSRQKMSRQPSLFLSLHFEAVLYLLCRHTNLEVPPEELLREVAIAADGALPAAVAGVETVVW